jgi:hypothetical protein
MTEWSLVMVKRRWVPHWLYGLFCPTLATKQPFRWLLNVKPGPFINYRVNGEYR